MKKSLADTRESCPLCRTAVAQYPTTGRLYRHGDGAQQCEGSGNTVTQAHGLRSTRDTPYAHSQPLPCCGRTPQTEFYFIDVESERACWTVLCGLCGRRFEAEGWDQAMDQWNNQLPHGTP